MGGASGSEDKKYLRVLLSADWSIDEEVEHRSRVCTCTTTKMIESMDRSNVLEIIELSRKTKCRCIMHV